MSILDRVSKAVGDVVDRGKKEVDQFVKIQKINSQIGDTEKNINQSKGQIQQVKLKISDMAIEMLRAGTLTSQEMQSHLDQINQIQQQIASMQAEIDLKRAEIENIKSDNKVPASPSPAAEEPAAPPLPPQEEAANRFCPQCGAPTRSGSFCAQCGSKLP
jgi:hypothetical protein